MRAKALGVVAAVLLHGLLLLFGGLLFSGGDATNDRSRIEEADLVTEETKKPEEKPEAELPTEEAMRSEAEVPPDMREILEPASQESAATPALDAMSLSALEGLLDPSLGSGGELDAAASLASGGRIGGTGTPGALGGEDIADSVFGLAELDQKPRALFQAAPFYPLEMRRRKAEGTVYVLFVVDAEGRVMNPRVERSTDEAFDKPALDAVKQWRFEPAVRNGAKVHCRMRVPIRFSAQG